MRVLTDSSCEANAQASEVPGWSQRPNGDNPRLLILAGPTLNGAALPSGFWERLRLLGGQRSR
jgi:hypothetical protein